MVKNNDKNIELKNVQQDSLSTTGAVEDYNPQSSGDAAEDKGVKDDKNDIATTVLPTSTSPSLQQDRRWTKNLPPWLQKCVDVCVEYSKFIGPGIMVSIAYMDPGNYSTGVAAGATHEYALLFVVFLSNIIAMFLQSLAIKLGCVTGNDLAMSSRLHFPKWLNWILYVFAEVAIIATDIAEVIGTAIALNILIKVPLMAGVALTVVDVILILLAYRPGKGMATVRLFEYGVGVLVLGIIICFIIELARIPEQNVGWVFKGYLPSHRILEGNAMYQSCGILGATVMPHSLYLGSGLVRPRLRDYDADHGYLTPEEKETEDDPAVNHQYQPSIPAIKYTMKYSIAETVISLCTLAIFVNSAILIVAGATMYQQPGAADADLYTIHDMLSTLLKPVAGTLFMLALLFSGQSAGIICTISGQMVAEGYINWKVRPWIRRIVTRGIAIIPCFAVVGAVGKQGLSDTLNATQVALSILLPFLTAPLIYLTCVKSVMTVKTNEVDSDGEPITVNFANNWITRIFGVLIWLLIAILNVYLIVHLAIYGE